MASLADVRALASLTNETFSRDPGTIYCTQTRADTDQSKDHHQSTETLLQCTIIPTRRKPAIQVNIEMPLAAR